MIFFIKLKLQLQKLLPLQIAFFFSISAFGGGGHSGGSGDLGGGNIIETQFNGYISKTVQSLTLMDKLLAQNYWLFDQLKLEESFTEFTKTLRNDEKFSENDLESTFHKFILDFQSTEFDCKSRSAKSDKQFCMELTNFFGNDDPLKCQELINSGRDAAGNKSGILFREVKVNKISKDGVLSLENFFLHEFVQNCMGLVDLEKSLKLSSKLSLVISNFDSLDITNINLQNHFPIIVGKGVNRDNDIGQKTLKGGGYFGLTDKNITSVSPISVCNGNIEILNLPDISHYTKNSDKTNAIKQNALLSPWVKVKRQRPFADCIKDFDEWNEAEVVFAIKDPPVENGIVKYRLISRKKN